MRSRPEPESSQPCNALFTILLLAFFLIGCREKQETPQPGPPEVEVTEVVQRNVPGLPGVGRSAKRTLQRPDHA